MFNVLYNFLLSTRNKLNCNLYPRIPMVTITVETFKITSETTGHVDQESCLISSINEPTKHYLQSENL